MNQLELTLPWQPTGLSPNARLHWAKLARKIGDIVGPRYPVSWSALTA